MLSKKRKPLCSTENIFFLTRCCGPTVKKQKNAEKPKQPSLLKKIKNKHLLQNIFSYLPIHSNALLLKEIPRDPLENSVFLSLYRKIKENFRPSTESRIRIQDIFSDDNSKYTLDFFFRTIRPHECLRQGKFMLFNRVTEKFYYLFKNQLCCYENCQKVDTQEFKDNFITHFQFLDDQCNVIVLFCLDEVIFYDLTQKEITRRISFNGEHVFTKQNTLIITSDTKGDFALAPIENKEDTKIKEVTLFKEDIQYCDFQDTDKGCFYSRDQRDPKTLIIYDIIQCKIFSTIEITTQPVDVSYDKENMIVIDKEKISFYDKRYFKLINSFDLKNLPDYSGKTKIFCHVELGFKFFSVFNEVEEGECKLMKGDLLFLCEKSKKYCLLPIPDFSVKMESADSLFIFPLCKYTKKRNKKMSIFVGEKKAGGEMLVHKKSYKLHESINK